MPKELSPNAAPGASPVYQTKPLQAHVDDSYKLRGKPAEPSVCSECGVVFQGGRWHWLPRPEKAHELICPACHRIRDGAAAGYLTLEGDFLAGHREEILNLARHMEKKEKADHPLQRIMNIAEEAGSVLVTTTDAHLARGIGEAIRHAYQGELDINYGEDENMIRLRWKR